MSDLYPTLLSLRKKLNQGPEAVASHPAGDASGAVPAFFLSCLDRRLTTSERIMLRRIPILSVQELARKAADPKGQAVLREHLDEGLAEKVIAFFAGG